MMAEVDVTPGPFVLLEGPDGGGKSTLAAVLRDQLGLATWKGGAPWRPPLAHCVAGLRGHAGATVLDRLHVSGHVYGRAFHDGPMLSPFEDWLVTGELLARGAVLVYCAPPPAVVAHTLASRPRADADAVRYEDPARQYLVRRLYEEYLYTTPLSVLRYNYTVPGAMQGMVGRVATWLAIQRWLRGHRLLDTSVPALGNAVDPPLVLVGDQPVQRPRVLRRAAGDVGIVRRYARRYARQGVVFGSESGRYLHRAMGDRPLDSYCVVNSVQLDGTRLAGGLDLEYLRELAPRVVALGRNAAHELDAVGVPHATIPHPQHWRRFHHVDLDTYARFLSGELAWTGCGPGARCHGGG